MPSAPSDVFSSYFSLNELTEPPCEQKTATLDWSRTPLRLSHEASLGDSASLDPSAKGSIFHVNDGELSSSISTKGLRQCPSGISSGSRPSLNFSPGMWGTHGSWGILCLSSVSGLVSLWYVKCDRHVTVTLFTQVLFSVKWASHCVYLWLQFVSSSKELSGWITLLLRSKTLGNAANSAALLLFLS